MTSHSTRDWLVGILVWLVVCSLAVTALAAPRKRDPRGGNVVVPTSQGQGGIALVIGNAAYDKGPLRNPVHDATDMAAALRDLGFDVTLHTDMDKPAMGQVVNTFGRQAAVQRVRLFYFAGHGLQAKGQNYLIPLRVQIDSEADVPYRAVPAEWVLAKLDEAGPGVNIIILDACRDNPYARGWRSITRGLARMQEPVGSLVAYATAPGKEASAIRHKYVSLSRTVKPGTSMYERTPYVRYAVLVTTRRSAMGCLQSTSCAVCTPQG